MNIIVLLTFISVVSSVTLSNENLAQTWVNELLEDVRKVKGSEDLFHCMKGTFPILDKFEFENEHVELCGFVWCINANITMGTLQGLGDYELIKCQFESIGKTVYLDLDIDFPSVLFQAEYYEMEGNIMGAFPLAGKGKLQLRINHLRLWSKVELGIQNDVPTIVDFKSPGFSIQNIICRTELDGHIDHVFNAMVEELLAEYLNRFNKPIAAHYADGFKELINPLLLRS